MNEEQIEMEDDKKLRLLCDELEAEREAGKAIKGNKLDKLIAVFSDGGFLLLKHLSKRFLDGESLSALRKSVAEKLVRENQRWLLDKHGLPHDLCIHPVEFSQVFKGALLQAQDVNARDEFALCLERFDEIASKAEPRLVKAAATRAAKKGHGQA